MGTHKIRPTPPVEALKAMLRYNPETGSLRYLSRAQKRQVDNEAGRYINAYGIRLINIDNIAYPVHRIVWKMHYGRDAFGYIKHLNGDGTDNRIANLVETNHSGIFIGKKIHKNNKVGEKNIILTPKGYKLQIWRNGKFVLIKHSVELNKLVLIRDEFLRQEKANSIN